jgi:hypothetical protein
MTDVAEALSALAHVLGELGVRWYVFGAQAAISYGASRVTHDVDVTIALGERPVGQLLASLSAAGWQSRATDAAELAALARVVPVVHAATGVPFDLVLAGPGIEETFLENARTRRIADVEVPVAAAEDIVTMKVLAGRPHDRQDVLAILRAQRASFDVQRVRAALEMLDDALDQSDLAANFEAAWREAQERGSPR